MICKNCGAVIEVGRIECAECGTLVPEVDYAGNDLAEYAPDAQGGQGSERKHRRLLLFTVLIILLIVAFGALAVSVLYATRDSAVASMGDLPRMVQEARIEADPGRNLHI